MTIYDFRFDGTDLARHPALTPRDIANVCIQIMQNYLVYINKIILRNNPHAQMRVMDKIAKIKSCIYMMEQSITNKLDKANPQRITKIVFQNLVINTAVLDQYHITLREDSLRSIHLRLIANFILKLLLEFLCYIRIKNKYTQRVLYFDCEESFHSIISDVKRIIANAKLPRYPLSRVEDIRIEMEILDHEEGRVTT